MCVCRSFLLWKQSVGLALQAIVGVYYTTLWYILAYTHKYIHNAGLYLPPDIDECANDFTDGSGDGSTEGSQNGCNQICTNTNGSFICECFSGYQLSDDMITCVGMWVNIYIYIYI